MMHIETEVYPEAVVLHLKGRFDFHTMDTFLAALSQAEKTSHLHHIILNLHHLTFIDSMAIGRLVGIHRRLQRKSIRLTLAGQTGHIDSALKDIKLEAMIPTVSSLEEGLALPPFQRLNLKGPLMPEPDTNLLHITTTETMVRFYVLLAQYIDRCLDETAQRSLPEGEFQTHLAETRRQVADLFATNRVVKNKTEMEFQRITTLCEQYLQNPEDPTVKEALQQEHGILRIKMLALSDLLAVFRSV